MHGSASRPTRPARLRRLGRLLPWLALAAWTGVAFGREAIAARAALATPPRPGDVAFWRLGDPEPERFASFLAEVAPRVPSGALVALHGPSEDPGQRFFLRLWAAYLLPRQRVVDLGHPEAPRRAEFLVVYGTEFSHPRLAESLRTRDGALYRVRPWTPPSP